MHSFLTLSSLQMIFKNNLLQCVNHFLSTEYNDIIYNLDECRFTTYPLVYNLDECRFTTYPLVIFFPAGRKICDRWGSNQVVHYSMHKNNRVRVKEPNGQVP